MPTPTEGQAAAKIELTQPTPAPAVSVSLAKSIPVIEWKDSAQGNLLVPIDPYTGQALPGYEPIPLGRSTYQVYSPDKHSLAVIGFASNNVSSNHPNDGSLHLINLNTWTEQVKELQLNDYINAMAFSPDGRQLAIAYGNAQSHVLVLNGKPPVISKTALRETTLDFYVYSMKFDSDGSGLMIYGSKIENRYTINEMSVEPPVAVLLNSADLSVRWQTSLNGVHHGILPKEGNGVATPDLTQPGQAIYLYPGLAFAPESDILYIVHADQDKLTTVDFAAQKVTTVEIKSQLTWFERLLSWGAIDAHAKVAEGTSKSAVISADGQYLYVVGQHNELASTSSDEMQVNNIPLGLQIIRTKNGSLLTRYDTPAQELSVSQDGRYLFLRAWGLSQEVAQTQVFDTSTDQVITTMDGTWLTPTQSIDGKPVLGSSVWMDTKRISRNSTVDAKDMSVLAKWDSSDILTWMITP